jgi:hypothetical protein
MNGRRLAPFAVATVLVGACGSSVEAGCQPLGARYSQLFEGSSLLRSGVLIEGEPQARASDVRGAWYIVARIGDSIPVWVTDRDPRGGTLGHIISGNRAAQRFSNQDFLDPPMSRSETAQAAGDPIGIGLAEGCISD